MKKNLFNFELDKVVISNFGLVQESTKETIAAIREKQDLVVINTNRNIQSTYAFAKELNIDYSINLDGQAIYDYKKNKYIWIKYFDNNLISFVFLRYQDKPFSFYLFGNQNIYKIKRTNRTLELEKKFSLELIDKEIVDLKNKDNISSNLEYLIESKEKIFKVVIHSDSTKTILEELDFFKKNYSEIFDITYFYENTSFLELRLKNINKFFAIQWFISYLKKENSKNNIGNVISISNSIFDLYLIKETLGIVFKGSPIVLKKDAYYITEQTYNEHAFKEAVLWYYNNFN